MKKLLLAISFIFISGCAGFGGAKGVAYPGLNEINQGQAQLYIYRPSHFVMSYGIPSFLIDNEVALSIRNGSYSVYNLTPGKHKLELKKNGNWIFESAELEVELPPEKRVFLRLSSNFGAAVLESVPEAQAVSELGNLLYTGSWP
ncbi:hypothetical protein R50073_45710 [Maricurvus nonylphenolicus]|uniref:DUF2846 domain-containing protein n=1 Tax=Maricurvus nonylphenolicus TaxID=1008307 RepID=UPI0036F2484D